MAGACSCESCLKERPAEALEGFDKRSEKQNAVTGGREKAGSTPPVVPGAAPALAKAGVGGFCS